MAIHDQAGGKSTATTYSGRKRTPRENTSADQSSASAVHPVSTWCAKRSPRSAVTRKAMIAATRAT